MSVSSDIYDSIDLEDKNITDEEIDNYLIPYKKMSVEELQKINSIYLNNNKLVYGFLNFLDILPSSSITTLSLYSNKIDDNGAILLSKYIYWSNTLKYIDISWNNIGYQGAKSLSFALKHKKIIKTFDISSNNIGSSGVNYIADIVNYIPSLKILNISNNNVIFHECLLFAESIKNNNTLDELDISNNLFIPEGEFNVNHYIILLKNTEKFINFIFQSISINNLNMENMGIDSTDEVEYTTNDILLYIATCLESNDTITTLSLAQNYFSNCVAGLLFDSLQKNTKLIELDLSNTFIDDSCIRDIIQLLGHNMSLQSISLVNSNITNQGLIELSNSKELIKNESIAILNFGEDNDEFNPIINSAITLILERNINLNWKPYLHSYDIFNDEMNIMLLTTLMCNTYGPLRIRLPIGVLMYIFTFFNRSKFINFNY